MTQQTNLVDWTVILNDGFVRALKIVISSEDSRLDSNEADRGNWTGGAVGVGILKGSKYGISAASYPDIDIKNLTFDQAKNIYVRDYAKPMHFDAFPTLISTVMLDAAINNGLGRTIKWMQNICSVPEDGVIGPITINAMKHYCKDSASVLIFCALFGARRLAFMSSLPNWSKEGGWAKRLSYLPYRAIAALTLEQTRTA